MSKKYKVEWAEIAENDLLKIIEYIAQNSPKNALKILRKIKKQVAELNHSPDRCRIVPELSEHGINQYREMIISPWRIIFRISRSEIYVISVIDSRRNIEDVLLMRLSGNTF